MWELVLGYGVVGYGVVVMECGVWMNGHSKLVETESVSVLAMAP